MSMNHTGVADDRPPVTAAPHLWDALRLLNFTGRTVAYEPGPRSRYRFDTLHRLQWAQPDTADPEQNDLWSDYLPSQVGPWLLF